MAKRLLAMVACEVSHQSPWFTSRGSEHCAKVTGKGTEDVVILEVEQENQLVHVRNLESGPNLVRDLGKRFRILKFVNSAPSTPTTVEVFY